MMIFQLLRWSIVFELGRNKCCKIVTNVYVPAEEKEEKSKEATALKTKRLSKKLKEKLM